MMEQPVFDFLDFLGSLWELLAVFGIMFLLTWFQWIAEKMAYILHTSVVLLGSK